MGTAQTRGRHQMTVNMDEELLAKAKALVQETPGLTLAGLIAELLRKEIRRRERQQGRPLRKMLGSLPVGRPRKVAPDQPLPPRPTPTVSFDEMMRDYEADRKRR